MAAKAARPKPVACPHDVNELLAKERQWMPHPCSEKQKYVWCDDCHQWVGFEFDTEGKQ